MSTSKTFDFAYVLRCCAIAILLISTPNPIGSEADEIAPNLPDAAVLEGRCRAESAGSAVLNDISGLAWWRQLSSMGSWRGLHRSAISASDRNSPSIAHTARDDLRPRGWKVYARSDRASIKSFKRPKPTAR